MIVYKIIALVVVMLVAIIWFAAVNAGNKTIPGKKVVLISLSLAILISAFGLLGMWSEISSTYWPYLILQLIFLLIGWGMLFVYKKEYLGKFKNKRVSEIMLLIFNTVAGVLGFTLLFNYFSESDGGFAYATASLLVPVPYFLSFSFSVLKQIPAPIYTVWHLDEGAEEPDFDKINIKKIILISLDIYKDVNAREYTNLKVKAPIELDFGEWFQAFILNYNEQYSDSQIQYKYLDETSMGWVFYTKPTFWRPRRFVDPSLNFVENKLNEKLTIVASRVKINYQ